MATSKRPVRSGKTGDAGTHQDVDALTSSAVADPHAVAFAERQKAPNLYDNPTIATPGQLEDIDEDETGGPYALVDPDVPVGLDPTVDNRDQIQPMLDTLAASATEDAVAQGTAVAATNPHESDAVDVEALTAEQEAKRDEARADLAKNREETRSATTKK